jgi:hypothetical protein
MRGIPGEQLPKRNTLLLEQAEGLDSRRKYTAEASCKISSGSEHPLNMNEANIVFWHQQERDQMIGP